MNKFYDPSSILHHKRAWNFLLGNRGAGKSFGFKKYLLDTFIKNKDTRKDCKFLILFRKVDDVKLSASGFFSDILASKYFEPTDTMEYKAIVNGIGRFYFNGELCGYAASVKLYQRIKSMPEMYGIIENVVYDEFLSEEGDYLTNEVNMIRNIYTTIARGGEGGMRNNVYMFFISNTVSMINPFFKEFPEIKSSMKFNTKRLVRETFQLEICYNQNIVDTILSTNFGKSLDGTAYGQYVLDNTFFNDNNKFIEKIQGQKNYIVTMRICNFRFAVYEQRQTGIYYISEKVDPSFQEICLDNQSFDVNFIMVDKNEEFIKFMKKMYQRDCVRFENLDCKISFLTMTKLLDN